MSTDFLDLNLLPPEHRSGQRLALAQREMIGLLGLGLLLFAFLTICPLAVTKISIDRRLAELSTQVAITRAQVIEADNNLSQEAQLQQQVQSTLLQADTILRQAAVLRTAQPLLSEFFDPMTQALPPRVTVNTMTMTDAGTIRLTGESGSTSLVLEFAQGLERIPDVRQVNVVGMDRLGGTAAPSAVSYTIEVERESRGR